MEITKETQVSDILEKYGDIAEVMELFGIKRVGRYSLLVASASYCPPATPCLLRGTLCSTCNT